MSNLKLLEKPKLTTYELLKSATNSLLNLADEYHNAEKYAKAMKDYHKDLATLVKRTTEIKNQLDSARESNEEWSLDTVAELSEELDSITAAIEEILTGVSELKTMTFNLDIKDIGAVEVGSDEAEALAAADDKFMKAYFAYKSKLNLSTQEDVARLVGLDRRQISNLENSKHKPQFKTIKKIAEGFGADIKEFI